MSPAEKLQFAELYLELLMERRIYVEFAQSARGYFARLRDTVTWYGPGDTPLAALRSLQEKLG